jgi:hypothetical protein
MAQGWLDRIVAGLIKRTAVYSPRPCASSRKIIDETLNKRKEMGATRSD